VSIGTTQFLPSSFCSFQTFGLKSPGFKPTNASMSSVMSVSRSALARFLARVRWEIATSGGLSPSVARDTLV
jgi:hypothetical protein